MEIVSTMGTGSLGREIDLEALVSGLETHLETPLDANFTSNGLVTIRLEDGGSAYNLYRTGSFQIRGARTEDRLFEAASKFRGVLSDMGVIISNYEFNHVTSVFMEDLGREVDLEALTIGLGLDQTEYEPEQFPGLIYRPQGFEMTLLVFATGKVIIGGTTDRDEARSAIGQLQEKLNKIA